MLTTKANAFPLNILACTVTHKIAMVERKTQKAAAVARKRIT